MITLTATPWRPAPGWLPPATRVYAIGDIHGHLDLLDRLLAAIATESAPEGGRRILVTLGDYVDRGPDSRGVIERLSGLALPGLESCCLRGNHEEQMMQFLDAPLTVANWLVYGGRETLGSYGLPAPDPIDSVAVAATSAAFRTRLPASHRAFLDGLPGRFMIGGYLFAHAGVRPGVPLARQTDHDLRWMRDEFLESEADHGAVIVHGHTIAPAPQIRRNRIGIDTGAFSSGRLTCLCLEGQNFRLLTTGRVPG